MIKEAWDALRAAILLDSELKRQREDILRALSIIRELAADNESLRGRLSRLEKSHAVMQHEFRRLLLNQLHESALLNDDPPPQPESTQIH
jgi:septal ring factor EnvC (AmiA/AmiB activator)